MEQIAELARRAHGTQPDKMGREYFDAHLRPIAAGAAVFGPDAEAGGWLHDVIEDTDLTAEDLLNAGVPADVVRAVESVTKRDGEPYDGLISRAVADPLGCLVKLVDNAWNITCNPGFAERDPEEAARLMTENYLPARKRLLAAAAADPAHLDHMQAILDEHLARLG